jgi:hypothetical protein
MNDIDPSTSPSTPISYRDALTIFKSQHYELPRCIDLHAALQRVEDQFIASFRGGKNHDARGVILTGGTRAGKTHDLKMTLREFAANPNPLGDGFERNFVRVSLRSSIGWKQLGSALLTELGYPTDLDHRSSDLIWRRVEGLLERQKRLVVQIDECQHLMSGKSTKELLPVLDGLKDMMKRSAWPVILIISGVPTLKDFVNQHAELVTMLQPVTYQDIAYSKTNRDEIDGIVVNFSDLVKIDPSKVRSEDVYDRMIHASVRRWGRLIELVTQTLATVASSGRTQLEIKDFAVTFQQWTGAVPSANVFLIGNPYAVQTDALYRD